MLGDLKVKVQPVRMSEERLDPGVLRVERAGSWWDADDGRRTRIGAARGQEGDGGR